MGPAQGDFAAARRPIRWPGSRRSARAARFIGQVADDQLGEVFAHDIRAGGIAFDTPARAGEPPTARCLIFVTPDGQRTMNTFLGASQFLPAERARRSRDRRRRGALSRRLSVGSRGAARGDAPGDRGGARRRAQGRLHAVRRLRHRPPRRRFPRADRRRADRHPVRQRARTRRADRDRRFRGRPRRACAQGAGAGGDPQRPRARSR